MIDSEMLDTLENAAIATLARGARDGDASAARALLHRVDRLRAAEIPAGWGARDVAVDRVRSGEAAAKVAEDMGVPSATVRSWVHRARGRPLPGLVVDLPAPAVDIDALPSAEALRAELRQAREDMANMRSGQSWVALVQQGKIVREMAERCRQAGAEDDSFDEESDEDIAAEVIPCLKIPGVLRIVMEDREIRREIRALLLCARCPPCIH